MATNIHILLVRMLIKNW